MKLIGISPEEYWWYIQMLKDSIRHLVGFEIKRLTRWICVLKTIWEAASFPKVLGIISL